MNRASIFVTVGCAVVLSAGCRNATTQGSVTNTAVSGQGGETTRTSPSEKKLKEMAFAGHTGEVPGLAFNADSTVMASASWDGTAKLWDVASGKLLHNLKHEGLVLAVAFSPDGRTLASCSAVDLKSGAVRYWNTGDGKSTGTPPKFDRAPQTLVFAPDGKTIIVAVSLRLFLCDVSKGTDQKQLGETGTEVSYLSLSTDGILLATADQYEVNLWDLRKNAKKIPAKEKNPVRRPVALSPDGKWMVWEDRSNQLKLWDVEKDKERTGLKGGDSGTKCYCFSPDSKYLAWSDGDRIVVLDTGTLKEVGAIPWVSMTPNTLAFTPDGKSLAAGGLSGQVVLWKVQDILRE